MGCISVIYRGQTGDHEEGGGLQMTEMGLKLGFGPTAPRGANLHWQQGQSRIALVQTLLTLK